MTVERRSATGWRRRRRTRHGGSPRLTGRPLRTRADRTVRRPVRRPPPQLPSRAESCAATHGGDADRPDATRTVRRWSCLRPLPAECRCRESLLRQPEASWAPLDRGPRPPEWPHHGANPAETPGEHRAPRPAVSSTPYAPIRPCVRALLDWPACPRRLARFPSAASKHSHPLPTPSPKASSRLLRSPRSDPDRLT